MRVKSKPKQILTWQSSPTDCLILVQVARQTVQFRYLDCIHILLYTVYHAPLRMRLFRNICICVYQVWTSQSTLFSIKWTSINIYQRFSYSSSPASPSSCSCCVFSLKTRNAIKNSNLYFSLLSVRLCVLVCVLSSARVVEWWSGGVGGRPDSDVYRLLCPWLFWGSCYANHRAWRSKLSIGRDARASRLVGLAARPVRRAFSQT